jgi:hypothetical protein
MNTNIQCFIPDWETPGHPGKQHAGRLYDQVSRIYPTTILNHPDDFFNAQWEKAKNLLTADWLLWIMADVDLPENYQEMFKSMERTISRGDVGWWACDVAWTGYIYDRADLAEIEPGVCEVPNTDSLLFAVRADVARLTPRIDPEVSFMWGLDFAAIVTAERMGLKTVRDYNFKAVHPNNSGYNIEAASWQMKNLFESFDPTFQNDMNRRIAWCNKIKRRP